MINYRNDNNIWYNANKQTNKNIEASKRNNANVSHSNHKYYFPPLFISMRSQQPNSQFKGYPVLYVPPGLTFKNSAFWYIAFTCFVWLSEQTVTFALHIIKRLIFITEAESVYCAVRTESLYKTDIFVRKGLSTKITQ